jgi:hypothetical protein
MLGPTSPVTSGSPQAVPAIPGRTVRIDPPGGEALPYDELDYVAHDRLQRH